MVLQANLSQPVHRGQQNSITHQVTNIHPADISAIEGGE